VDGRGREEVIFVFVFEKMKMRGSSCPSKLLLRRKTGGLLIAG